MPVIKTINKAFRSTRVAKRLAEVRRLEKSAAQASPHYKVIRTDTLSPELLKQAKKLHAYVYLQRGFIDPTFVGAEGTMHDIADPHQHHSDYFAVVDEAEPELVLATARQIRADHTHSQLPILALSRLYDAHRKAIYESKSQDMVEISGLAKKPGISSLVIFELYLAMWAESMRRGHRIWLMACDVRLYNRLKILFGDAIMRIGHQTHYKGGDVIPCRLDLAASERQLTKNLRSKHVIYGKVRRRMAEKFLQAYLKLQNA